MSACRGAVCPPRTPRQGAAAKENCNTFYTLNKTQLRLPCAPQCGESVLRIAGFGPDGGGGGGAFFGNWLLGMTPPVRWGGACVTP